MRAECGKATAAVGALSKPLKKSRRTVAFSSPLPIAERATERGSDFEKKLPGASALSRRVARADLSPQGRGELKRTAAGMRFQGKEDDCKEFGAGATGRQKSGRVAAQSAN